MKPSVYIESTIPSYLTSDESSDVIIIAYQRITRCWWKNEKDKYRLYVSPVVIDEISSGDKDNSKRRLEMVENIEILE